LFPESRQIFPESYWLFPESRQIFPESYWLFPESRQMWLSLQMAPSDVVQVAPKSVEVADPVVQVALRSITFVVLPGAGGGACGPPSRPSLEWRTTSRRNKYLEQICGINMWNKYLEQICGINMWNKYVK
jgi:hypothetical protein